MTPRQRLTPEQHARLVDPGQRYGRGAAWWAGWLRVRLGSGLDRITLTATDVRTIIDLLDPEGR